ncbi:SRPBCC family protein [Streptomyces sp. NBC_01264]|uniref:SRPBCC family protein n=1 Tax=Streptomyces sp. NBC_01264 TaxID=2903804 RepID=UPI002256F0D7|nr:SRPBCC family protein [Streptomyces sp. NBC_01264]MCX4782848.1 SRPBCC family protein [Streptomyces sp. NBC_01264]
MITVERNVLVGIPLDELVAYLADFGHAQDWDPGTVRCVRIDEGPLRPGATWHNTSRFRGRTTHLVYRLESGESHQLVFTGANKTVEARDVMRFESRSAAVTRLTYTASLRFKGLARLAEPFLRSEFEVLADKVAERLPSAARRHLA